MERRIRPAGLARAAAPLRRAGCRADRERGGRGRGRLRAHRHPRQQCRRGRRRSGGDAVRGDLGLEPGHQPEGHVPDVPGGDPRHEAPARRAHHQRRVVRGDHAHRRGRGLRRFQGRRAHFTRVFRRRARAVERHGELLCARHDPHRDEPLRRGRARAPAAPARHPDAQTLGRRPGRGQSRAASSPPTSPVTSPARSST